jgi:hypothetical protein
MTFSVGKVFLALSTYLTGAFIARAHNPEQMLPVYYLALGLANPASFGTSRIQALVISFCGDKKTNRKIFYYALCAGCVCGLLPLVFILPGIIHWYYVTLQNLPVSDLPLVRMTALALVTLPLTVGIRAYGEGKAANLKKPVTVLAGQAVFLGIAAVTAFFALSMGIAGNMIGVLALLVGNITAAWIIFLAVNWEERRELPVLPAPPVDYVR